jgi:hypothetical protein
LAIIEVVTTGSLEPPSEDKSSELTVLLDADKRPDPAWNLHQFKALTNNVQQN